ncbi:EcsC family protein [Pseudalkalibacillus berkeleyi]|uniref:EcsC family protein n=1 Tax=Pseudalkalibacillus berkeleyi TaxID=1069813 RepID=A0ABS9GTM1_9BACL|nr:EcsC family protein [Pseudalkalibacillus berkeleyi]MCF6136187.1 EcsC family protein [Pseudalkalibacillus berkeleyi]
MDSQVKRELNEWEKKILKRSPLYKRAANKIQKQINQRIPEKVHNVVTNSIMHMIKATLTGTEYTTKRPPLLGKTLQERDGLLLERKEAYKKTAMAEGAGTGAGGILWGLADFPLLVGIKMRFLFESARIYGYDTRNDQERIFLLHIFLLAFSSDDIRKETYVAIKNWEQTKEKWATKESIQDYDWRTFQITYRDHIDLAKMLQMVPGFGAIVGAYVNYHFLDQLGETAMNCYRLRYLHEKGD